MNFSFLTKRMGRGDYLVFSSWVAVIIGVSLFFGDTVSVSLYYDYFDQVNNAISIGFLVLIAVITILSVRRLHDIGLSGFYFLIPALVFSWFLLSEDWTTLSYLGIIIITEVVFLVIKKGTDGPNMFGDKVESKKRKQVVYWIIGIIISIVITGILLLLVNTIAKFTQDPYGQQGNPPSLSL